MSDKKFSSVTINRKLASAGTFYKYLLRKGLTQVNPISNAVRPKKPKKLPEFVFSDNLDTLLSSDIFDNSFKGQRNKLIIEILYLTGIRRAELINLKIQNISEFDKTIKVLGKRNKERIIPLADSILDTIKKYLTTRDEVETESDNVFLTEKGAVLYPKLVYNIVKKHLQLVSSAKKLSPHVLRHSFATTLLNRGADINAIKELLGHESLAATQIYTHNTFEKLAKVYNQAHPRAK